MASISMPNTGTWDNWRNFTVSNLQIPAGRHVLRLVFDDPYLNINWLEFSRMDVAQTVIVDNSDPGVAITGAWTASDYEPPYGLNYLHDGDAGKGKKSVRWTPTIDVAGNYTVQIFVEKGANRATNVPVDIIRGSSKSTVTVNQRAKGGWVTLGTWALAAGTGNSVTVRTTGTNGYVIADAVRFVPVK